MLLTWAVLFLWTLRRVCSVPIPKGSLTAYNWTIVSGEEQNIDDDIPEYGVAVRLTTIVGEVQGFYKYHDGNATDPKPLNPVSTTNNDGALNKNGTPTIIPMQKCPDPNPSSPYSPQKARIHFLIIGIATESRYDLEANTSNLRSPCLPPATTTTTTTTTAITPSDGSGKDLNQPGGIIHTLIWTTIIMIIDISHH